MANNQYNYEFGRHYELIEKELKRHEARTDNPHNVTKGLVGLGFVDNTSDADKPVSTQQKEYIDTFTKSIDIVQDLDTGLTKVNLKDSNGEVISSDQFLVPGSGATYARYDDQQNVIVSTYANSLEIKQEDDSYYLYLYSKDGTILGEKQEIFSGKGVGFETCDLKFTSDEQKLSFTMADGSTKECDFAAIYNLIATKADKSELNNYYTKTEIDDQLKGKVDKKEGYDLSKNDFTDEEKSKLDNIESGAQVNKIETVKVNGTALDIKDKSVDITLNNVEANPEDAGTVDLEKIRIDETIYNVAGGVKYIENTDSGSILLELENKRAYTLTKESGITDLTIKIPSASIGFISEVVFKASAIDNPTQKIPSDTVKIINNSSKTLKLLQYDIKVDTITTSYNSTVDLLFYCDGINLICYMNEIIG